MSVTIDGILWPPAAAQVGNIIATFSNSAVQYAALNVNVTSTSANSNSALAMITLNGNTVFFMNAHPYESAKSTRAANGKNTTVTVVWGADRSYASAWGYPGVEGQYGRPTYQFHTSVYNGQGLGLYAWNTWREGGGIDLEMIKSNSSTIGVMSPVDANTELGFLTAGGVVYYDGFDSSENIAVQAAGISFDSALPPVSNSIYTSGTAAYMPALPGKIRFWTANNSEPYMAERMMIDANGNVFIRNGSLVVENGQISIPSVASFNVSTLNVTTLNVTTLNVTTINAATINAATINAATINAATINAATMNAATINAVTINATTINATTMNATTMNATTLTVANNLLANSGYGSEEIMYGVRAWVHFRGSGTVTIRRSGNISSITDVEVGEYVVNFQRNMPDINYACLGGGRRNADVGGGEVSPQISFSNFAVGSVALGTQDNNSDGYQDCSNVTAIFVR